MKITCIIENQVGVVIEVVIDDMHRHAIEPGIPRSELAVIGQSVAELHGYIVDCDTLELMPIHATTPQS